MALARLSQLVKAALDDGYALAYFEAWDTYSMEAVVEAAEEERSPVVIGFGGMTMEQSWLGRFGIEPLGAYGRAVAERTSVPAAFLLNEVWELYHALRGVAAGFNTVMLNTCHLPFEENIELTRNVVERAHPKGVEVQAELGRVPDFGRDDEGVLTDPGKARQFVEETGVDFLAVSIGNVHLRTEGKVSPDLGLLEAIHAAVDTPLVMHGGSGFPEEAVPEVIDRGIALFHVGTVMKKSYLEAVGKALSHLGEDEDYQAVVGSRKAADFLLPGKQAIKEAVKTGLRLYGSSQRAV